MDYLASLFAAVALGNACNVDLAAPGSGYEWIVEGVTGGYIADPAAVGYCNMTYDYGGGGAATVKLFPLLKGGAAPVKFPQAWAMGNNKAVRIIITSDASAGATLAVSARVRKVRS